jgi:hypothetical protein
MVLGNVYKHMNLHVYVLFFGFVKVNFKLTISLGFKCIIIESKIMNYGAKSRSLTLSGYLINLDVFLSIVNLKRKIKELMQMLENIH